VNNCKNCGIEVLNGVDYCRDCAEKHLSTKPEKDFAKGFPESAKILEQERQSKNGFTDDLRDGAFQKGINWRKTKLEAIHKARHQGVSDELILRELRIGGITIQKARELMKDSEELLGR
jgi:hypothetical protein